MVKPALIYKSANPRALKGKNKSQLPVYWMSNKKAWTTRSIFLEWFQQCFVPDTRKYLMNEGLPFRVLLILDNAPGHPGVEDFNTEGVEVIFLPPNTTSLLQPLDQGVIRSFKAHYSRNLIEKILQVIENDPGNLACHLKKFTIADAIKIIKKSVESVKADGINSCWKNLWPECVTDFEGFTLESVLQDIQILTKQLGRDGDQDIAIDDIEKQIYADPTAIEISDEDLFEMTSTGTDQIESDDEDTQTQTVLLDKFTIDNLAEGIRRSRDLVNFFYDIDPSMIRSLEFKEKIEEAISTYKHIFDEKKRQKTQPEITMFFQKL